LRRRCWSIFFWSYKVGVASNNLFQQDARNTFVGISGDSGVGKSTLAKVLENIIGEKNVVYLNGDDLHKWERGDDQWKEITHLHPGANYMQTDLEHAVTLLNNEEIERREYDHSTGSFTKPKSYETKKFIIAQGLHSFFLEKMRNLYDLKIYMEAEDDLRIVWKLQRDSKERGHSQSDIIMEQIVRRKPDAEKFVHPQKEFADWIIRYSIEPKTESLKVDYWFKNSMPIDPVIEELVRQDEVTLTDTYVDINYRHVSITGSIPKERLKRIAYRLFPNIEDYVDHIPEFEDGISGINQLFFVHFLSNHYKYYAQSRSIT